MSTETNYPGLDREPRLIWLALTWALLIPMLVFAAQGAFSFEHGTANTEIGASSAGLSSAVSQGESLVTKLQTIVVYLLSAVIVFPYARIIATRIRRDVLLFALIILPVCSMAWSQNPRTTLIYSMYLILDVGFALYLMQRFDSNSLMKLVILTGILAAVGSIVVVFALPQYGIQGRGTSAQGAWQGIFGQKNVCGEVLACLLTPIFFVKLDGQLSGVLKVCYAVGLLFIIGMTQSAGSWGICAATIIVSAALLEMRKMASRDSAVIWGLLLICTVGSLCAGVLFGDSLLVLMGKDPTLTGRTVIWGLLAKSIAKHPVTGYGYMAFWQGLSGESANIAVPMGWPGITYAENGLVELWVELGLIGLALFLTMFARAVMDAIYCYRRSPNNAVMWYISILVFTVFSNVEAGKIFYPSNLECMLQIIAMVGLKEERTRIQALEGACSI